MGGLVSQVLADRLEDLAGAMTGVKTRGIFSLL